jgi:NAD(P)-dependent dehydrogenase (short-subunit alcohol dehydrogenase family)
MLITGSNSGFGLLSALTLARQGHQVIATMRDPQKSGALDAAAEADGLDIEVRVLDVNDPGSVEAALFDAATIDVLINNAGFEVRAPIEQLTDELMSAQLETNVMGPLRTMRAVLGPWRERGSGVIVNVSSIAGRVGTPYAGAYAASKYALEAMSESLHFEMSAFGIRVHLIEPGRFDTGFGAKIIQPDAFAGSIHEQRHDAFRDALGALDGGGSPADPQEVADAIARAATDPDAPFRALCGDDARLIDGAKTSMSFEDFDATMRATLNWHD